jgi:hypothetical protein
MSRWLAERFGLRAFRRQGPPCTDSPPTRALRYTRMHNFLLPDMVRYL